MNETVWLNITIHQSKHMNKSFIKSFINSTFMSSFIRLQRVRWRTRWSPPRLHPPPSRPPNQSGSKRRRRPLHQPIRTNWERRNQWCPRRRSTATSSPTRGTITLVYQFMWVWMTQWMNQWMKVVSRYGCAWVSVVFMLWEVGLCLCVLMGNRGN